MKETIAVIGATGPMGRGVTYRLARAGYPVIIGSRVAERAHEAAAEMRERVPGARVSGDENAAAAAAAEIVVLTVPYAHHRATLETIQEAVQGKVLVDATVPLRPPKVGRVQLPETGCAAVEAQQQLGEDVQVVAALQNVSAHALDSDAAIDCDVLVSGNDVPARERVMELLRAAGMRGWHAGPLANSAAAEALTSVLIQLNRKYRLPGAGIRITPGAGHPAAASYAPDRVEMVALRGLPPVAEGMDLADLIMAAMETSHLELADDDILVVAQKVVSKAEGRVVALADVRPSAEALERAKATEKDPALVQLILDESREIVRQDHGVIITEHRLGFVMANAGVDQSNTLPGHAVLLPLDPDDSARRLAESLGRNTGRRVGVVISDSFGRAWRNGTVGHAIGVSGVDPLIDLRGTEDLSERPMQVTEVGLADEIAAGASALMGQGAEAKPVVLVRGFARPAEGESSVQSLLRPKSLDLFR